MKHKIVILILVVIGILIQYKLFGSYKLDSNVISDTITFFSIAFGFYITSLSIFATSKYICVLHKKQDPDNPSLTLLNHLINNYKFGLILVLATICYLILIQFYITQIKTSAINLNNFITLPIGVVFIANIICFYIMLHDLIRV